MWQKYALFSLLLLFVNLFAYTFFSVNFYETFSMDLKSAWNSAFFDIHFKYFPQKNVFAFTLQPNADEAAQKNQKRILKMCPKI